MRSSICPAVDLPTSASAGSSRAAGPMAVALVAVVLGLDLLLERRRELHGTDRVRGRGRARPPRDGLAAPPRAVDGGRSRTTVAGLLAAARRRQRRDRSRSPPGAAGLAGLTGGAPRPYTHSLVTPLVLIAVGAVRPGRARPIAFGAAFGVGAHLFRDLCTGPGLAIAWPLSSAAVRLPYLVFAAGLVADRGGRRSRARRAASSPPG